MKLQLLVTFLVTSSIALTQSTAEKMEAYMQAAHKAGIFNGSVLVMDKGNIVLNKGYGIKNAVLNAAADENTIYQIGSVTKQFTATLILQLAEQGKLNITDKVSKYLPEFPHADKITIEQLLSHTAGVYNYTNDGNFMQNEVEKPLDMHRLFAMVKDKELEFEPGTKFNYSNTGYMLLGYIIEKVTGQKYEQVARQQIFAPLQMNNTGFDFTHLSHVNKAIGYEAISDGKGRPSKIVDSTVSFSAGAIYSTVSDLQKWNDAVAAGKILNPTSLQNAFTPRKEKYGLGWGIDTVAGKRVIIHGGGIHGFLSYNYVVPEERTNIILLSNAGSSKPGDVFKGLQAILNNKPYKLPEVQTSVALNENILKQYTGEYELAPQFVITVRLENGNLKAQATGQPEFDLYAKNETEFFLKVVDAQVHFVKNDKGEVEKLILHQNGRQIPGVRKK